MTPEYLLEIARNTIEAVDYCFLITLSESGQANARLVQHFKPRIDMTIWVGTSRRTRKVREICNNNRITVTFQDEREHAYVMLLGSASVETDLNHRQRHWQMILLTFPAGISDDYVVIKFVPNQS